MQYRDRDERPLTSVLPAAPAAVRVYGDQGTASTLCLDLDAKEGGAAVVERDAARLEKWLAECGARTLADVSPNGGRHVYVPLRVPLDYGSARELVEALATLFPTLDPGPHRSLTTGCIRPPGAVHASGGHQQLTVPLAVAYDVLQRRNGEDVVEAMRVRLRREIAAWRAGADSGAGTEAVVDAAADAGVVGRGALGGRVLRIAREGVYDATRYASASEARQAVIAAAVRAGWRLADVAARVADGRWPGLAALYARYAPTQRRRALARDWTAARRFIVPTSGEPAGRSGKNTVRISNTSAQESQGGAPARRPAAVGDRFGDDEHAFVRTWRAQLRIAEQRYFPGRAGYGVRFVLRAMAQMAHATGSRYIGVGTRSLAVAAGMDHSTVSVALKAAAAAGWCDRLEEGRGEHADLYALTLPGDLAETAPGLRWDKGRVHALRPAFRALGHVAALVFEAVEAGRAVSIGEVVAATSISRSAATEAVEALTAWGLLDRDSDGLAARPELLGRAAEQLGVLDVVAAQIRAYARQRAAWRAYLARHDPDAAPGDVVDGADGEEWWWPPDDAKVVSWTLVGLSQVA